MADDLTILPGIEYQQSNILYHTNIYLPNQNNADIKMDRIVLTLINENILLGGAPLRQLIWPGNILWENNVIPTTIGNNGTFGTGEGSYDRHILKIEFLEDLTLPNNWIASYKNFFVVQQF
jgi:hypothetical protein